MNIYFIWMVCSVWFAVVGQDAAVLAPLDTADNQQEQGDDEQVEQRRRVHDTLPRPLTEDVRAAADTQHIVREQT